MTSLLLHDEHGARSNLHLLDCFLWHKRLVREAASTHMSFKTVSVYLRDVPAPEP